MTRLKLYGVLLTGILIGIAGAQTFQSAQATPPETTMQTIGDHIAFLVKGEEVARLDAKGFAVNGNVEYGGYLANVGMKK